VAYLAFAAPGVLDEVLGRDLPALTPATPGAGALRQAVDQARAQGWARADQTLESEVSGIALPLFGADGFATGALAVATPTGRLTDDLSARILAALAPAARQATLGLGGRSPDHHRIAA